MSELKPGPSEHAFDLTKGDWRVTGDYEGEGNIIFYHKGEACRRFTVPGYKIWNVPAHADDIISDLEAGMRIAMSDGLGGIVPHPEVSP